MDLNIDTKAIIDQINKNNFLPGEWENKNIKLSKKQITIDDKIINEIKNFAKKKNLKID